MRKSLFVLWLFIPILIELFATPSLSSSLPPPSKYGVVTSTAAEYAKKDRRSLDENGVLVFDYGRAYDSLGKWHNPLFIARYAHTLYKDWHQSGYTDESLKANFLVQARFLVSSFEERDGMACWSYPFENTYFGVEPGWISGIGQSHIAGVLLRAWSLTGEPHFRDVAMKALEPYFRPMASGGVVTDDERGFWVQEVASPEAKVFCILNGHITGILGLLDIATITGDDTLLALFHRGVTTVRDHLSQFDAGFSSFYSLEVRDGDLPKIAPRGGYNAIHAWQLEQLFEITGDLAFKHMADRFRRYEETNDARIAKGSTNPLTHGPAEAAGWFGNRYWSHRKFPTWYEVHMSGDEPLDGVFIAAHTLKGAPRSLTVSLFQDKEWVEIWSSKDNAQKVLFLRFDRPALASGLRLDIASDNGNNNVALDAVMPVRSVKGTEGSLAVPSVILSILSPGFRNE